MPDCAPLHRGSLLNEVRDRRVREVLALIESGPRRSVRELAREIHLSISQLERLFKQKIGAHIRDFLVEQRLERAAQLLCATGLPIKEIAHAVGYGHQSSFTRAFENRFAQSPKQYREQSDCAKMLKKAASS